MKRAKILNDIQIELALEIAERMSADPERDCLMILLSFRTGMRAQEIAYLELDDVTDAQGQVARNIQVTKRAAKNGRARVLPMSPILWDALSGYIADRHITGGPLFLTRFRTPMSPNAVEKQIARIYQKAGFQGASSHSGRRTFITRAAQQAGRVNCSLKDVQLLAGHAEMSTTGLYIEPSGAQIQLVKTLYDDLNQERTPRRGGGFDRAVGNSPPSHVQNRPRSRARRGGYV